MAVHGGFMVKNEIPKGKNLNRKDPLAETIQPWRFTTTYKKTQQNIPNIPRFPTTIAPQAVSTIPKGPFFCPKCNKKIETKIRLEHHKKKCLKASRHKLETRDVLKNMKLPY